jgi:hypothetical protein
MSAVKQTTACRQADDCELHFKTHINITNNEFHNSFREIYKLHVTLYKKIIETFLR